MTKYQMRLTLTEHPGLTKMQLKTMKQYVDEAFL
jgi:hypothetical protein